MKRTAPPSTTASPEGGPRFAFGRNWRSFLRTLDDDRIARAEASLVAMLGVADLAGRSFLDVGSGSGLFSLAARRLGARVVSFDFDAESVACTATLRERFFPGDAAWTVERGSVLDAGWTGRLGSFDVVYSWGVLHHTGDMWRALDVAAERVAPGGLLFIALYNDQGRVSRLWRAVKRVYVSGPLGRAAVLAAFVPAFSLFGLAQDLLRGRDPRRRYRDYRRERGMSVLHDWVDWLGGYPFEFTAPGPVVERLAPRGFTLRRFERARGLGNHQFVFERASG